MDDRVFSGFCVSLQVKELVWVHSQLFARKSASGMVLANFDLLGTQIPPLKKFRK
jgi:hypothetical protein